MFFTSPPWTDVLQLIGEITVFLVLGLFLLALAWVLIATLSIRSGKVHLPRLISSGFIVLEGGIRALCGLVGLEDRELVTFFIKVHNSMNLRRFGQIPVSDRAIFLPQCLRSSRCPAHLTPEGLHCQRCGQCTVGEARSALERLGYRVFIVPGSSFIQRMVRKYHPQGLIGAGCIIEVKEGLEMCDRLGICSLGVVTLKDGCVETLINWSDVFELATLGLDPALIPKDLDVSSQ